jgi:hypothetical protein
VILVILVAIVMIVLICSELHACALDAHCKRLYTSQVNVEIFI